MANEYILSIDAGTTGIKVSIFDNRALVVSNASEEFTQYTPSSEKVEHDANEIWYKTLTLMKKALQQANIKASDIASIGITNQRTTIVVWDKHTGEPIHHAIVWQDQRTADEAEFYKEKWGEKNYKTTGLVFGAVNSTLFIKWILDHVPGAKEKAASHQLLVGTIDTWLTWKLTKGKVHAVSYSNASATSAFDITNLCWYKEWLNELDIPVELFPEVRDDLGNYGATDPSLFGEEISINALIADQHAAMFAQNCREAGHVKCTHGTGSFLDVNIGDTPVFPGNSMNTILGWKIGNEIRYAMEGYVSVTGAAVQWLRDGAKLIENAEQTEELALSVEDNGGVYFVPALAGLSAPYWDSHARGMIIGIHRGTQHGHLIRATLEGIVYSIKDFLDTISRDAKVQIQSVKVDGGGAKNNFMMQFQADMLHSEVVRPLNTDATILGAAFMAGLATGFWENVDECYATQKIDKVFQPLIEKEGVDKYYERWCKAVSKTRDWMHVS